MSDILVSVIIATYRRNEELKNALESISVQTHPNIEIVVVDDNFDTEQSKQVAEIVSCFSTRHPSLSVKYICNKKNLGSALSRNEGIYIATGDYICFLDDDDVYLPCRIKNQLDAMLEYGADYSLTDLQLYSENGKLIETRHHGYITDSSDGLLRLHLMHHLTGTDTMMFKKDYLLSIGGFSPINVGDEFYLMQKAIEAGGKFLYLPICDVKAYVHTGESGLSSGKGKIDGENALFEHKKQYFDKLDKKAIRYIKMRHYAVIAYAYLRMKQYAHFAVNAMISFISTPIECVKLFLGR